MHRENVLLMKKCSKRFKMEEKKVNSRLFAWCVTHVEFCVGDLGEGEGLNFFRITTKFIERKQTINSTHSSMLWMLMA